MAKKVVAYAWMSGLIRIGTEVPRGALPIAWSEDRKALDDVIIVCARHAYDGVTLLVPGIPEAESYQEALRALADFVDMVEHRLERRLREAA